MKILYIDHYAGSIYHGMEFRPYYLSREWVKSGHKVRIIAADFSHLRKDNPLVEKDFAIEEIDGIEYQWVKAGRYSGNGVARALTMFRFVWKLLLNAKCLADEYKPDLVISSSTYPLDAYAARRIADLANAKMVHEIHDMWPITPMELYGMSKWHPFVLIMQMGENFFCRRADKVVSILPCAKEYLVGHGMQEEKFAHVPNGIVLSDWECPEPLPEKHKNAIKKAKAEGRFVILFFGSHTKSYSIDYLLKASALCEHENLFLAFVGDGNYKSALIGLAKELCLDSDSYSFLPPIAKRAIPSLAMEADACYVGALRNKMFKYGIGMNKLFDSMMSGKPLLYAVDAPNNMVEDYDCGISVEAENVEALKDGILKLISLPESDRFIMGNNGKQAVMDNFHYEVLAKKFLKEID